MSMCRVFSCVVGRGCLLWPVCSLGKTLLAFALLHSVLQGQICPLLQVFDFLLLHSSPQKWKGHLFWVLVLDDLVGASLVAQRIKCLPAMRETWVWSLGWEDPLEKKMATHSRILAWRIPWTEKPGGLQSMESQSWTQLSNFTFLLSRWSCRSSKNCSTSASSALLVRA